MTTRQATANAFAAGKSTKCHNAQTNGIEYRLHGNLIAQRTLGGLVIDWCGWYTPTTAAHLNSILRAFGVDERVSYAAARDAQAGGRVITFARNEVI